MTTMSNDKPNSISKKYFLARPYITAGDIVLFRGKGFLAKAIQYFDKAYYNHIGVVYECCGRLMIVDSMADGVHPEFLSTRIKQYQDFCVIIPNSSIRDRALSEAFRKADEGIEYDYWLLPRIALSRKLRADLNKSSNTNRDICSEWVRRYTDFLQIKCYSEHNVEIKNWITPEDFRRFADSREVKIFFDNAPSPIMFNY
jgi:hypothetical protein